MTIIGGAMFGPRTGAFLAWSSCLLGTIFAHELARRIARKPMLRLFGRHRRGFRGRETAGLIGSLFMLLRIVLLQRQQGSDRDPPAGRSLHPVGD